MIAWVNCAVMLFSALLMLYFYVRSVSPASLEKLMGGKAYAHCYRLRLVACAFEGVVFATYVLYFFFPLPIPLPKTFPWDWGYSIFIAALIGVPAFVLMMAGVRQAGIETLYPQKEQNLFGGIYQRMRHPQAAGEVWLWWSIAFALHSPFLCLFSFVFLPIYLLMCHAEEQDLLLRFGEAYAEYCRRTPAFLPRRQAK